MTRVVVSGLGVVSPYGTGAKTFWTGLASGTCAIRPLTAIDTEGFRSRIGAEVPADVLASLGPSRRRARADRLAMAAAREALADADLSPTDRACAGLFVGAVGGGMLEAEAWYWEETRTGRPSPTPRGGSARVRDELEQASVGITEVEVAAPAAGARVTVERPRHDRDAVAAKVLDRVALVLLYHPERSVPRASETAIRAFLGNRKELRPGALQLLLILNGKNS